MANVALNQLVRVCVRSRLSVLIPRSLDISNHSLIGEYCTLCVCRSTFAGKQPMVPDDRVIRGGAIIYRRHAVELSPGDFVMLLTEWSILDPQFRVVHNIWLRNRVGAQDFVSFWRRRGAEQFMEGLTDTQRLYTRASSYVQELQCFHIDAYTFSAHRPDLKTDNSCVMSDYNEQGEGPRAAVERRIAYGRVRRVFRHFIHRGGQPSQHVSKIFIQADWYKPTRDGAPDPTTGLVRIRRHPAWDSCSITPAQNVHGVPCAFWKVDPFDARCTEYVVIKQRDTYSPIQHR